jgi:phosphate transport system permease protein
MFTATVFAGATLPDGIRDNPVLSLPYHIFILAQDSYDPATVPRLWGTALTLLMVVFTLSLIALPARLRLQSSAHHD